MITNQFIFVIRNTKILDRTLLKNYHQHIKRRKACLKNCWIYVTNDYFIALSSEMTKIEIQLSELDDTISDMQSEVEEEKRLLEDISLLLHFYYQQQHLSVNQRTIMVSLYY